MIPMRTARFNLISLTGGVANKSLLSGQSLVEACWSVELMDFKYSLWEK
jgi:hypothetical protein